MTFPSSFPGLWVVFLALAVTRAESPSPPDARSAPTPFRGWERCYRLTNGSTEAVIVPDAGARVVVFALQGANVLFVDEKVNGRTLKGEESWMPWDGSAPDTISPEGGSQLAHVWLGAYEVMDASRLALKCRSKDNVAAGIRMVKEFSLDPDKPRLTVTRRLTNLLDRPAKWSFWERTLVPGSATGLAPINPKSIYAPGGWAVRGQAGFAPAPPASDNPKVADGVLILRAGGTGAAIGLDANEGWTAALVNGILFTIEFPVTPDAAYPWDRQIANVFFYAENRIELEPVSPYLVVEAGGTVSWTIRWQLLPVSGTLKEDSALASRIRDLRKAGYLNGGGRSGD